MMHLRQSSWSKSCSGDIQLDNMSLPLFPFVCYIFISVLLNRPAQEEGAVQYHMLHRGPYLHPALIFCLLPAHGSRNFSFDLDFIEATCIRLNSFVHKVCNT